MVPQQKPSNSFYGNTSSDGLRISSETALLLVLYLAPLTNYRQKPVDTISDLIHMNALDHLGDCEEVV